MAVARNGDVEIHWESFGSEAQPTLVLVNGLGSQCVNYEVEWCELFVAEGLRVIRLDNRDVGLSSHLADGPPYTLSDMAADVVAVLDAAGVDKAHVMGLSMGGMIVQTLAIEHADRLLSVTSVMSGTGDAATLRSSPEAQAHLFTPAPPEREAAIEHAVAGLRIWGSPAFADEGRWRANAARAYDRAFDPAGVGRQMRAVGGSPSRTEALGKVTLPFLVIHGDKDTLVDQAAGRATAAAVPGARFELIEGMGHDYPPQLWRRWTDLVVGHIRTAAPA
jgi:pimeloyl-ACP methyl ester carboxylesterase